MRGGPSDRLQRVALVSRSLIDAFKMYRPEDYVVRGEDHIAAAPAIPADQMAYLRKNLP